MICPSEAGQIAPWSASPVTEFPVNDLHLTRSEEEKRRRDLHFFFFFFFDFNALVVLSLAPIRYFGSHFVILRPSVRPSDRIQVTRDGVIAVPMIKLSDTFDTKRGDFCLSLEVSDTFLCFGVSFGHGYPT